MTFDFKGKNILVTGASRGIGKAIAMMFAKAGGNVIIHYNKNQKAADGSVLHALSSR